MKQYLMISFLFCASISILAQNSENNDPSISIDPEVTFNGDSPFSQITIPAPQARASDNITWEKTIWRIVDMREQINFPLYYPLESSSGRKCLFMCMFDLLREGKINAYRYSESKEDFTENSLMTFEEVLSECEVDVFEISTNDEGETIYEISEVDVPNQNVLKYYIKEVWYFDTIESSMKCKIIAIAPQLYSFDDNGDKKRNVMFWIPFDDLRPWLAKQPVVINNNNSASTLSYDDLFQKRRFVGHIFKEDNIKNRTIIEYCQTPSEVHAEQSRIENEILNFESDLWEN